MSAGQLVVPDHYNSRPLESRNASLDGASRGFVLDRRKTEYERDPRSSNVASCRTLNAPHVGGYVDGTLRVWLDGA